MKVQILFNDKNPRHKALIDYLEMQGKQSGVPKELLLLGFESLLAQVPPAAAPTVAAAPEKEKEAVSVEKAVKGKVKPRVNNINSIAGG